jgi:hypothetical protein
MRSPYGHPQAAQLATTLAALKLVDPKLPEPSDVVRLADGRAYIPSPTSTLTADDFFVVQASGVTVGRWLLAPGFVSVLTIPFTFSTADAAALVTLPTNSVVRVDAGYWNVAADFTGGASSAIGLSSSNAAYNTKGDLLGGAAGDVAAALTAGAIKIATVGVKIARGCFLVGGNAIRFDRITSAFTAGSGNVVLPVYVIANPGA